MEIVIEKQVISYVRTTIEITEITLLSIEEYRATENIPLNDWWWLRSPGDYSHIAACVDPAGNVFGECVNNDYIGVRPALRINPASLNLQIGGKAQYGGLTWTYVEEGILLCDSIISYNPFRKNWKTKNANKYEASNVKNFVDSWFAASAKITAKP